MKPPVWLIIFAILAVVGLIQTAGEDDDSKSEHPYFDKAVEQAEDTPVIEVGDLARCQKLVGSWVFFEAHHEPFTAPNREIVDGVCRATSPSDRLEVVGQVALEEIQAAK